MAAAAAFPTKTATVETALFLFTPLMRKIDTGVMISTAAAVTANTRYPA